MAGRNIGSAVSYVAANRGNAPVAYVFTQAREETFRCRKWE